MNTFKAYYHYVNDPINALKTLCRQRAFKEAFWGYFVAALSWVLFFNIGSGTSIPVFLLKLSILFIAEITAGYVAASLGSLFLDFSSIKASAASLFILAGTSGFVKALLVAFALIAAAFPFAKLEYLAPLALLLVLGLQLGYLTRGVMRLYKTGAGKALTSWLFTIVPLLMLCVLCGIFLIWGMVLLF